ncbi:MAG: L-threonylcarbamoyladenylate synthase [Clostridia bacterium]|nr:L-threonylcarbamoyladenylate synthase [Clostridia bacterium]
MDTQILDINETSISIASKLIHQGQIVAFPTETVYGLGADTFNEQAVSKIFLAKGRPSDNPLIVHISDNSMLELIAQEISSDARILFDTYMPSSLTVVLKKKSTVPDIVTAGLDTVAIRMPRSSQARIFINACNTPIAAPSANTSGRPSPTDADAVYQDMQGKIPLILRGDKCAVGIESTVISLVDKPIILRPGIVTQTELESLLNKRVDIYSPADGKLVNSPGVRFAHYRPSCATALFITRNTDEVIKYINSIVADRVCVICKQELVDKFGHVDTISLGIDDYEASRNYFGAIRQAEANHDYIVQVFYPEQEVGQSLLNRMTKSAYGNIYKE